MPTATFASTRSLQGQTERCAKIEDFECIDFAEDEGLAMLDKNILKTIFSLFQARSLLSTKNN